MDKLAIFSKGDWVKVTNNQLNEIKDCAKTNERKRSRLCMHGSPENKLQDMFICRAKGDFEWPHKHETPESHLIIEGRELIVIFSDNGEMLDYFILDKESGILNYRVNTQVYHMTILLTDLAIDYEVKLGPYLKSDVVYAPWGPEGKSKEEADIFMKNLMEKIDMSNMIPLPPRKEWDKNVIYIPVCVVDFSYEVAA